MLSRFAKMSSMLSSLVTLIASNFFDGSGGSVLVFFTCGKSSSFLGGATLVLLVYDYAAVEEV